MEGNVSSENASEILVRGARALAHSDSLGSSLDTLLAVVAEQLDVESAVVIVDGPEQLRIVASVGLEEPALGGLTEAIRNPGHPITRTFSNPVSAFDVLPSVPGGPALRSHLPLVVTRHGSNTVLGVLAIAHGRSLEPEPRRLLEAVADLAAIAVERDRASR
jgi:GAF domain-containing protein